MTLSKTPLLAVAAFAGHLCIAGVLGQTPSTKSASTKIPPPPSPTGPTDYTTENALGSLTFTAPICVATPPGERHRLFVVERDGTVQVVTNLESTLAKSPYLDLKTLLPAGHTLRIDGENGLLGLAFHPQFARNATFFVFYSFQVVEANKPKLFQRVAKIVVADPTSNRAGSPQHTPLITQLDQAANHNGGDLAFGPDGYLYFTIGDEGAANDVFNNARFIDRDFFGAIFRIDVDLQPSSLEPNPHSQALQSSTFPSAVHAGAYRIPKDNPFVGATSWHGTAVSPQSVRMEIWATGLRNVWRMAFDPKTGRLFAGDVGQITIEEVDIITKGADYGWSWREGTLPFALGPAPTEPPAAGFNPVEPIYVYDRIIDGSGSDDVIYGLSITGGEVYRGSRLPELAGAYVFADYVTGIIAAIRESKDGKWTGQRLAVDNNLVDFGIDPRNGDVLFCDLADGLVKRLARSKNSPPQ